MDARIGPALGGLALLLVAWNTYTLTHLEGRLNAMELSTGPAAGASAQAMSTQEPGRMGGPRAMRQGGGEGQPLSAEAVADLLEKEGIAVDAIDLEDPNVQGRIAQIVEADQEARQAEESERRMEQYMDSVTREVEDFAAEHGLDDATTDRVVDELRVRSENWGNVRREVSDGNMSWFDARKEFQAVREESDAVLNDLLGEEKFNALDTQLWGDRNWGR